MMYSSTVDVSSRCCEGVTYKVARISFRRRLELVRRVREIARTMEIDAAGTTMGERLDAAVAAGEIDRLYLEWGLLSVEGLEIDGEPATPQLLLEFGPEELCHEIAAAIKRECGLSPEEQKN